jgi:hypothetical protein
VIRPCCISPHLFSIDSACLIQIGNVRIASLPPLGYQMKLLLVITAAVLLAALIGWAIVDPIGFRHKFWGYSKAEQDEAWQRLNECKTI